MAKIFDDLVAAENNKDLQKQFNILNNILVKGSKIERSQLNHALELLIRKNQENSDFFNIQLQQHSRTIQFKDLTKGLGDKVVSPPDTTDFKAINWETAGNRYICAFRIYRNAETKEIEIQLVYDEQFDLNGQKGLLISNNTSALISNDLYLKLGFAYSESYNYGRFTNAGSDGFPMELCLSRQKKYIAVSDIGRGTVYILDMASKEVIRDFQIRESGNNKKINMAFSNDDRYLFVTDNITNKLHKFDIMAGSNRILEMGSDICGNLIYSHTKNLLYILLIDPYFKSLRLASCDPETGEMLKNIPVSGEAYSLNNDYAVFSGTGRLELSERSAALSGTRKEPGSTD